MTKPEVTFLIEVKFPSGGTRAYLRKDKAAVRRTVDGWLEDHRTGRLAPMWEGAVVTITRSTRVTEREFRFGLSDGWVGW